MENPAQSSSPERWQGNRVHWETQRDMREFSKTYPTWCKLVMKNVFLSTNICGMTKVSWEGWGWERAGDILHFWRPWQQGWLQRGGWGFALGCNQRPSSSSGHRRGSAEPGTGCELLWGLGAQVSAAAEVVTWPEWVLQQHFPGLIIHNTVSPHAFFWKPLKIHPAHLLASVPPPTPWYFSCVKQILRGTGNYSKRFGHCWGHCTYLTVPTASPCPCGDVLSHHVVTKELMVLSKWVGFLWSSAQDQTKWVLVYSSGQTCLCPCSSSADATVKLLALNSGNGPYILMPMFGQLGINDWSEATHKNQY